MHQSLQFGKQENQDTMDYQHANCIHTNSRNNSLWLGDIQAAQNHKWLRENNIRTVITFASGIQLSYDPSIRHYKYSLQDNKEEKIFPLLDQVGHQIDNSLKYGSVLAHCMSGVSRSASFVIAYMIKYHKVSFLPALKYVRKKRKQICPNINFQAQLKKYDLLIHTRLKDIPLQKYELPKIVTISQHNDQERVIRYRKKVPLGKQHNINIKSLSPNDGKKTNNYMSESNPVLNTRQEFYVKKLAEFRFGATNMGKWGIQ